ncbi:MAG TPA: hypothetical protein VK387_07240 [Thermoleophilaceae bacterium]|nr:hypothetical protein [Thermoleophilaceae bacterium]
MGEEDLVDELAHGQVRADQDGVADHHVGDREPTEGGARLGEARLLVGRARQEESDQGQPDAAERPGEQHEQHAS